MKKVCVNICRLLLAVVLIFSGFVKAVDPMGTQYKIDDYLTAMHLGQMLPDIASLLVAVALAALEFSLGVFMLFAIQRRLTSRLVLVIMLVMTPLTLWLALADPIHDCGCFGDAVVLTNWQTFWKNVVLLAAAVIVALWPKQMFRFVSESNQWIVINYTVLFVLAVAGWSLYDLPQLDFRPYKVGTDLRDGWQRTWEGEDLPYADLFLERTDTGEDVTETVLTDEGYTFLLVAPHLEQANDAHFDQINEIYEYSEGFHYPFYCLTASGPKGINRWQEMTGAEYPFCQTDEIVLKTIIRSNPGLLLLKDGVIIRKWSHNRLPSVLTSEPLDRLSIGQQDDDSVTSRIARLLLWFVLPLALLVVADRTWAWTRWLRRRPNKAQQQEESNHNNNPQQNN